MWLKLLLNLLALVRDNMHYEYTVCNAVHDAKKGYILKPLCGTALIVPCIMGTLIQVSHSLCKITVHMQTMEKAMSNME